MGFVSSSKVHQLEQSVTRKELIGHLQEQTLHFH